MSGKESAMFYAWEGDKVVGLYIPPLAAASTAPTKEEQELVRIFKEYKQLQAENERLKEFIEETDNSGAYQDWKNCNECPKGE